MDIEGAPAESAGTEPPATAASRRSLAKRLLGLGVGGAVVAAVVPQIGGRAGASTPPSGGAGSASASTTTTTAPKRPTEEDVVLLNFVQGAEIGAYQLYQSAKDLAFTEQERTVVEVVGQSHLAYAQAISGLLGREASNEADSEMVPDRGPSFTGDVKTMLQAAYDLESALVATHESTIGQLVGTDGAYLLSSIVTVEGRNGTVFASLMGSTDLSVLLVDNEADALTPAKG